MLWPADADGGQPPRESRAGRDNRHGWRVGGDGRRRRGSGDAPGGAGMGNPLNTSAPQLWGSLA